MGIKDLIFYRTKASNTDLIAIRLAKSFTQTFQLNQYRKKDNIKLMSQHVL